jgi:dolichol-phosphate mannosyltransferase
LAKNLKIEENEILVQESIYDIFDKDNVTVVIPTLNEEKSIGIVLDELQREGFENILIIDGHSSDLTVKEVKKYKVKIIMQENKGKADAIIYAIKHVTTPYIFLMDGDCTYDPKDMIKFSEYIPSFNLVVGARITGRENIPPLNRFGNGIISLFFNLFFGTGLSDVCSGMYLLKTDFARQLNLSSYGFEIEAEILAKTATVGGVAQVPINYRSRIGKQKLRPFKDGYNILKKILKLGAAYNPITFFSMLVGSSMIALSFIFAILTELFYSNVKIITSLELSFLQNFGWLSLFVGFFASFQKQVEQRIINRLLMKK